MLGGKYHQESAKNGISELLDFKIFWGSMPPPHTPLKVLAFSASQSWPLLLEKSGCGPVQPPQRISLKRICDNQKQTNKQRNKTAYGNLKLVVSK